MFSTVVIDSGVNEFSSQTQWHIIANRFTYTFYMTLYLSGDLHQINDVLSCRLMWYVFVLQGLLGFQVADTFYAFVLPTCHFPTHTFSIGHWCNNTRKYAANDIMHGVIEIYLFNEYVSQCAS